MRRHVLNCLLMVMMVLSLGAQEKIEIRKDVEVYPLTPGIWRHVTYEEMERGSFAPANGLIIRDNGHAVMIDTPWTPEQTAVLLDWVEKSLKAKVEAVVLCHSHQDCLGGLPEIHRRGIASIGMEKTRALALARGVEAPRKTFSGERRIKAGGRELELFYPGHGHTTDNIVVWIADERVLFGGCLVRSGDARTLGYTAEADLASWPATLNSIKTRYPEARCSVPGHGDPGGWELVDNTLKLIAERSR